MNYINSYGSEFLNQVNSIISENLDNNDFGVSEMAVEMAMSRSSLHRRFKEITGVPTSEFIRNYRLERSKNLLKNSLATISEVAYACGFTSLTYFDISFKAYFGITPGEYRDFINEEGPEKMLPKDHYSSNINPVNLSQLMI